MKPRVFGASSPSSDLIQQPRDTARVNASVPSMVPSFLPSVQSLSENAIVTPAPAPAPVPVAQSWNGPLHMPDGMNASMLTSDQAQGIVSQVRSLSIHELSLLQIAGLGSDVEIALHKSLGSFLDRIDKGDSPQIFRLVSELNAAVKAEDLDGLADKILNGTPGFMSRMMGMLNPKKLAEARANMFEEVRLLVSGKTRKLSSVLDKMEKDIEVEKAKALEEARNLERLKDNYRTRFGEFVMATAFLSTMLEKAKLELSEIQAAEARGDFLSKSTLQEAQDKVQALESRALAVEGVLTKLPAEQLVIRQIQTATIQTVQEITTTTAGRFASIKMTLLTQHSAMGVQNLQRTAQQGADLDANLSKVRNRLVTSVVTTAANAPGDNRLQQANQLLDVVKNMRELQSIVEKARVDNQAKFDQARTILVQARADLTELGAVIRPDKKMTF